MSLFKKKNEEEDFEFLTNDLLIVFNQDKKTSDVAHVSEVTEDAVIVEGKYKVPIEDCEITTGKDGRNFFYRAPAKSITETERLARLEMNTVLTQMTAYREPHIPNGLDGMKIMLVAVIVIALIIVGVVAA